MASEGAFFFLTRCAGVKINRPTCGNKIPLKSFVFFGGESLISLDFGGFQGISWISGGFTGFQGESLMSLDFNRFQGRVAHFA